MSKWIIFFISLLCLSTTFSADERIPLPLNDKLAHKQLSNMREFLEHIQIIVEGFANSDFKVIEKGVSRFTTNPDRINTAKEMGRGDQAFADMGIAFLSSGDALMAAVKSKDMKAVNTKLGEMLQNCNACHAAYKQKVVSDGEFNKLKASVDAQMKSYVSNTRFVRVEQKQ